MDLALNNLQRLICHKTQTNKFSSMDRTLSGVTDPGQSGPGSDGNEGVLHIPQKSCIIEASP